MAKCSLEWKDAKAGGKLEKDANWPKFWSACNTRLKAETEGVGLPALPVILGPRQRSLGSISADDAEPRAALAIS